MTFTCNLNDIFDIFEEKMILCFRTKLRNFGHSAWRRHSGGARHSRSERRASCRLGRVNHASTMQRRYSLVLMLLPPILYWLLQCYELLHTRAAVTLWASYVNNHQIIISGWVNKYQGQDVCLFVYLFSGKWHSCLEWQTSCWLGRVNHVQTCTIYELLHTKAAISHLNISFENDNLVHVIFKWLQFVSMDWPIPPVSKSGLLEILFD